MNITHPDLAHAASLDEAEAIQVRVRDAVRLIPFPRTPHRVVGCDAAYARDGVLGFGAAAALDYETLRTIETKTGRAVCSFPYVPGLFAFRELPILLEALKLLTAPPDLILVEGHGIAHPRGAGLASHLGVILDLPTIGCAKTPLGGLWQEPPARAGAWTEVRWGDRPVGLAYRPHPESGLLFLSPGHRVDLPSILQWLPHLMEKHRLPEPLARAHEASVRARGRH